MICDSNIYEYPETDRIIIIGDVHGDIKRFKKILIDAHIINNNLEWIAEPSNTIIVQMGDQIDSANRSSEIKDWEVLDDVNMLYFTSTLNNLAKMKGGLVISLIGNHELLNVMGVFSYVSKQSMFTNRQKTFQPMGSIASILSKRPIIVKIGKLLFCHAGLKKKHVLFLKERNKPIEYLNEIWSYYLKYGAFSDRADLEIFNAVIAADDGILWTRNIGDENDLDYVLEETDTRYMFIGHNPVETIKLVNGRLWLTDTGISRAFATERYQYIDIKNKRVEIKTVIGE